MEAINNIIKSGEYTDIQIIKLLDSVPSDLLKDVFNDKSDKIQKYKSIYLDILETKNFENVNDIVEEINLYNVTMSESLFKFVKSNSNHKSKIIDFGEIINIFENYTKEKQLGNGYDETIYKIFKRPLDMTKYKSLDRFRLAILISNEIIS